MNERFLRIAETIRTPFILLKEWFSKQTKVSQYVIGGSLVLITCCGLYYSCSVLSAFGGEYDFKSSEDAIHHYRTYLYKIREMKSSSVKEFTKDLQKWQEMNDTVASYLVNDTILRDDSKLIDDYRNISDSTRQEFIRLAETWKCSYEDVIAIKEQTSPFRNDTSVQKAVTAALPFFIEMDKAKQMDATSKEDAIMMYRAFLERYEKMGIHSKKQMLAFIQQEDLVFRNFLTHLYELEHDHITDITHATENICNGIFSAAMKKEIEPEDAMIYMSMRTNRRLLQNSRACVTDISKRKMRNKIQANAYLWMIIQPFTSIDAFTMATMTAENRQELQSIAKTLGKSAAFAKAFDVDPKAVHYLLPQQMIKMYVMDM